MYADERMQVLLLLTLLTLLLHVHLHLLKEQGHKSSPVYSEGVQVRVAPSLSSIELK